VVGWLSPSSASLRVFVRVRGWRQSGFYRRSGGTVYVKKPEWPALPSAPALPSGDEWSCGFRGEPTTLVGGLTTFVGDPTTLVGEPTKSVGGTNDVRWRTNDVRWRTNNVRWRTNDVRWRTNDVRWRSNDARWRSAPEFQRLLHWVFSIAVPLNSLEPKYLPGMEYSVNIKDTVIFSIKY